MSGSIFTTQNVSEFGGVTMRDLVQGGTRHCVHACCFPKRGVLGVDSEGRWDRRSGHGEPGEGEPLPVKVGLRGNEEDGKKEKEKGLAAGLADWRTLRTRRSRAASVSR